MDSKDRTKCTSTKGGDCLLTAREVGRRLAISERTVWKLLRQGQLVRVRIGRSTRVRESDIDHLMQNRLSAAEGADAS